MRRAEAAEATAFVVGLPLDDQGDDTPRAIETRMIAAELEKRTGLPVRLVDERYTTAAALRTVREMGGTTRGRKGDVDALALQLVLHARRLDLHAPPHGLIGRGRDRVRAAGLGELAGQPDGAEPE